MVAKPLDPFKTSKYPQHTENPLHGFATYNSLFTLSGLTQDELDNQTFLYNTPHHVIARSAGIGEASTNTILNSTAAEVQQGVIERRLEAERGYTFNPRRVDQILQKFEYNAKGGKYGESAGILARNHDLFIEDVNIMSTVGPNTQRNLANVTKLDFKIHEPYSITFTEKVRGAAYMNGFLDYQDAPFLLTIEFKGTDEHGKMPTNLINSGALVRKIPILIVRVEFEVNEGGAVYDIIAVPINEMAYDDRYKMSRTKLEYKASTPSQWATTVKAAIKKDMEEEIQDGKRQYADEYKFTVHPDITKKISTYVSKPGVHASKSIKQLDETEFPEEQDLATIGGDGFIAGGDTAGPGGNIPKGTSIPEALSDYMRSIPPFSDLASDFWKTYLTMTNVVTDFKEDDGGFDFNGNRLYNNKKIAKILTDKKRQKELYTVFKENQYVPWFRIKSTVKTLNKKLDNITKMHPKEIHYRVEPYKVHILKLLQPGLSIGKVNWDEFVRKSYNYLYTGENQDIQSLRLSYKSAYYMRAVREDKDSITMEGAKDAIGTFTNFVLGREEQPEINLPLRTYPSIIKGRSTAEDKNERKGKAVSQAFFDYLTNPTADMMNIQIDILGDPAYICQDTFVPVLDSESKAIAGGVQQSTIDREEFSEQFQSFNADRYQPIINLKYRLPADINEKKGEMFSREAKTMDENLFFSGVYQVYKIDNRFENGAFTQTLHCVRMNNQSGEGAPPTLVKAANISLPDTKKRTSKKGYNTGAFNDDSA